MTNSAKGGYQKRPRQLYGPDYKEKTAVAKAVEMMEIVKSDDFTHSHRTTTIALQ